MRGRNVLQPFGVGGGLKVPPVAAVVVIHANGVPSCSRACCLRADFVARPQQPVLLAAPSKFTLIVNRTVLRRVGDCHQVHSESVESVSHGGHGVLSNPGLKIRARPAATRWEPPRQITAIDFSCQPALLSTGRDGQVGGGMPEADLPGGLQGAGVRESSAGPAASQAPLCS